MKGWCVYRLRDANSRHSAHGLNLHMSSLSCLDLVKAESWTEMTSDINYNQQEESASRNLVMLNFHVRCNLLIKWTMLWWNVRCADARSELGLVGAVWKTPDYEMGVYGVKRCALKQNST